MALLTSDDTRAVTRPLHFHACLDSHPARPASGQRVWRLDEVLALFELPFSDLMLQAQTVHRAHFDPNVIELAALVAELANLSPYPESVPINHLVKVAGTPLADQPDLDPLEFVRTIAVARITMPMARVRLSAGRQSLGEAVQALCFVAGANSIFYGDKLLTTSNPQGNEDLALLAKLGLQTGKPMPRA